MSRLSELAQMPDLRWEKKGQIPEGHQVIKLSSVLFFANIDCLEGRVEKLLYQSSPAEMDGVAAGLCLLITGTDHPQWSKLKYREFESFLRTKNDIPAFAPKGRQFEELAQNMLTDLKEGLFLALLKLSFAKLELSFVWGGSPADKAVMALQLQDLLFRPVCQKFGLTWEIFALEGENFIFKGRPENDWELSTLKRFIRHIFERETLNIVAEK